MTVESDVADVADAADKTIKDAEKTLRVLAERLEKIVQDAVDLAKERSKIYADNAGEQFETAQKYVSERVQERPLTATMTALGVGVFIGLLLGGSRR